MGSVQFTVRDKTSAPPFATGPLARIRNCAPGVSQFTDWESLGSTCTGTLTLALRCPASLHTHSHFQPNNPISWNLKHNGSGPIAGLDSRVADQCSLASTRGPNHTLPGPDVPICAVTNSVRCSQGGASVLPDSEAPSQDSRGNRPVAPSRGQKATESRGTEAPGYGRQNAPCLQESEVTGTK